MSNVDEWYKTAYYDPQTRTHFNYPIGMDTPPTLAFGGTDAGTAVYQNPSGVPASIKQAGGLSSYGTMAHGGHAAEWEETDIDLINDDCLASRGWRGGS